MYLTAKNSGLQEENIASPNCRERPLIRKTGWGTTARERETDGQKERERGRERERERERERGGHKESERKIEEGTRQCFMKKDDKSLIDVENVETTGEMCFHLR